MAAFGKVAQWSQTVLHTSRHSELVNLACKSAILNRGVSHLVFPDEVQGIEAAEGAKPGGPRGRLARRDIHPPDDSLQEAVQLLGGAKRPVIIVGHGARFDMDAVLELADALQRRLSAGPTGNSFSSGLAPGPLQGELLHSWLGLRASKH